MKLVSHLKLLEFVRENSKDRDKSHGFEHFQRVANLSNVILLEEIKDQNFSNFDKELLYELIFIVAYLHDIYDYKYDNSEKMKDKVRVFLTENLKESEYGDTHDIDANAILFIIDHISYSKEKNLGKLLFYKNLKNNLSELEIFARHIVSDADKIDALGKRGYIRCYQFIKEKNPTLSNDQIKEEIKKHAEEKLFKLKDSYIRTKYGKLLAERKENKLRKLVYI